MHTLDAIIDFIVNMTFLLQATAMFTKMHDSTLRIYTLKKISAMQDKVLIVQWKDMKKKWFLRRKS